MAFWFSPHFLIGGLALCLAGAPPALSAETDPKAPAVQDAPPVQDAADGFCAGQPAMPDARTVCADIVALDQTLVYNRFGSFNPYGMIFALARDVDPLGGAVAGMPACESDTATRAPGALPAAGEARLRDCKRPRPLVLRANVGDVLVIRVTNLLQPRADFSAGMCGDARSNDPAREAVRDGLSRGTQLRHAHGEASCSDGGGASPAAPAEADINWPRTRNLNFVAQGLLPLPVDGSVPEFCLGTGAIPPGASFTCRFRVGQEGTHFFASNAAPAGGNGDGGAITHGLFGAVLAERPGTRWYRSQVSRAVLDRAWPTDKAPPDHARTGALDYEAVDPVSGVPYLNLAQALDRPQAEFGAARRVEIVHGDLNAIVYCDDSLPAAQGRPGAGPLGCAVPTAEALGAADPSSPGAAETPTMEPDTRAFREFTVFFHDELKTFYTRNFEELGSFGQLAGVRDGFAINYGASGMGTLLLANRKGIGPAATCAECLYEEFFLTSWANGDPALLEWFDDDPSNVHHSYLNDPVVFRNFHAGPKETHVFHLHAHQWFAGNDPGKGGYLDSQTVGPGQGFTYNIYHGGRGGAPGTWSTGGSGNRNRTVGDSIFHCHLYPHFAQGMWALWRVHDVLEDGSRKLPDGQARPGLSTYIRNPEEARTVRPGSVDPLTGAWTGAEGTPVPALVPLPGEPLPPLPTYAPAPGDSAAAPMPRRMGGDLPGRFGPRREARTAGPLAAGPERLLRVQATAPAPESAPAPEPAPASEPTPAPAPAPAPAPELAVMPGYPFYIAGSTGHRPPQAPLDIATDANGALLSGGLGRHVVAGADREAGIALPQSAAREDAALAAALSGDPGQRDRDAERRLERLRAQIVAKAVAMGDMTAHLKDARIRTLPPDGTPLEKAAMDFHHDGGQKAYRNSDGTPAATLPGGYRTTRAPVPGGTAPAPDGIYQVNGSAPKPGAPFADPCGVAVGDPLRDQLTGQDGFIADPAMIGFRRYEASAVQLDLVVNKAGWHDPQARINVLTATSDDYKLGEGIISPRISDQDEPFFFRALSGECLEFRHTNELPKELALDDFQVRTPTDTIGQHIHLVKFDVTASDGSGNGWNYEDGTFAPDELMARRCAATALTAFSADPQADPFAGVVPDPDAAAGTPPRQLYDRLKSWGTRQAVPAECAALNNGQIWRRQLGDPAPVLAGSPLTNRDLFQTTAQRWFADPILTRDGTGTPVDRTMRTVFSHDHFGPSSIQQHGFYTALLIEPAAGPGATQQVCSTRTAPDGGCVTLAATKTAVADSPQGLVGAARLIDMGQYDPLHPNYREFALAIADFALLYDPRDRAAAPPLPGAAWSLADDRLKGIGRIYCEAEFATRDNPAGMNRACAARLSYAGGRYYARGEDVPPAWIVAGRPGDYPAHRQDLAGNLFLVAGALDAHGQPVAKSDAQILRDQLVQHRFAAAFPTPAAQAQAGAGAGATDRLAQPVAGPARPESISVDHHDPYLVNYRMAAVPLRLGTRNANGSPSADCAQFPMSPPGQPGPDSAVVSMLRAGSLPNCSYRYQLAGAAGDAAFAFSSLNPVAQDGRHDFDPGRDPETPILESYQNERIVFRLIQGAQEVQHVFNIAGLPFRRNIDQIYPQAMRPLATLAEPAPNACFAAVRRTHPEEYDDWLAGDIPDLAGLGAADLQAALDQQADPARRAQMERWRGIAQALARCDNLEGMVFGQEVGISEHFEMRGRLRQDLVTAPEALQPQGTGAGGMRGHDQITDFLYNFGTLDSLWNGDWGLLRIYRDSQTRDARLGGGPAGSPAEFIGARLRPLTQYRPPTVMNAAGGTASSAEAAFAPEQAISSGGLPTCPLPLPGRDLRYSTGYVVALRTGDVTAPGWTPNHGTPYGLGQYDRDGLMLALLPDLPGLTPGAGWGHVDRAAVLRAVGAAYPGGPEPFVMRVNAGDCVVLRFVNTLAEPAPGAGIRDVLGDAILPPITPLNSDPVPVVDHASNRGELRATTTPETGLRPSARLALTLGLPGGASPSELPLGFGLNAPPMQAAGGGLAPITPAFAYYAGRVAYRGWKDPAALGCVIDGTPLSAQLDACVVDMVGRRLAALRLQHGLTAGPDLVLAMESDDAAPEDGSTYRAGSTAKLLRLDSFETVPPLQWLIRPSGAAPFPPQGDAPAIATRLCPAGMTSDDCAAALTGFADSIAAEALQAHVVLADAQLHWIPYAFGPVPLRVTGDMISQPVHGLFGVVDVLPRQWPLPDPGLGQAQSQAQSPAQSQAMARILSPDRAAITDAVMAQLGLAASTAPGSATERGIRPVTGFGQGAAFQASMSPDDPGAAPIRLREFVLFYQDGLNLRDSRSGMIWHREGQGPIAFNVGPPVPDCAVCDDSYDRGEQGVSYRSAGHVPRLREMGAQGIERHQDLNARVFPPDFFARPGDGGRMPLRLTACQGEQVVIRVVHPGGRARQRAFVMNGLGYDDLYPGFGFPNAALVAPGKTISAWLAPRALDTAGKPVSYLWSDGPAPLSGGGTWGLLDMLPPGSRIGEETCPSPF